MKSTNRMNTKKLVTLAMLAAITYVVLYLSKLIPFSVIGFLKFDFKDVIIVMTGFMFGPLSAAAISILVSVVEMVTISETGFIGLVMNVLSTCAFACIAAYIYKRDRTMKGAVIGLVLGTLIMTVLMLLWNYLITPIYMGMPRQAVGELLLPVFLPFNLVKGGLNSAVTLLIYKPIVRTLRRAHMLPESDEAGASAGVRWGRVLIALVVLGTFVLLALVLLGII